MTTQRNDDWQNDQRDDASDPFGSPGMPVFEGFGEFGVSSDELPAVQSNAALERARWAREQHERVKWSRKIALLHRQGWISNAAYDLLQLEFSEGGIPAVWFDRDCGWYRVWSAREQRRYSLAGWERHAQEYLEISDPERATLVYPTQPPALFGAPAPATIDLNHPERRPPWHPALNSRLTPPPQWRVAPPITPAPPSRWRGPR